MRSERADNPPAQSSLPAKSGWVRDLSIACAKGDRHAVDLAHRRFAPGLRALFVKRLGGPGAERRQSGGGETADDLCQRTWTMVWEAVSSGKYDPDRAAISTFIYAVGNMVWLRHLRAAGRAGGAGVSRAMAVGQ